MERGCSCFGGAPKPHETPSATSWVVIHPIRAAWLQTLCPPQPGLIPLHSGDGTKSSRAGPVLLPQLCAHLQPSLGDALGQGSEQNTAPAPSSTDGCPQHPWRVSPSTGDGAQAELSCHQPSPVCCRTRLGHICCLDVTPKCHKSVENG